eukprot:6196039-Pleurochrysis_carterae.AAC.3
MTPVPLRALAAHNVSPPPLGPGFRENAVNLLLRTTKKRSLPSSNVHGHDEAFVVNSKDLDSNSVKDTSSEISSSRGSRGRGGQDGRGGGRSRGDWQGGKGRGVVLVDDDFSSASEGESLQTRKVQVVAERGSRIGISAAETELQALEEQISRKLASMEQLERQLLAAQARLEAKELAAERKAAEPGTLQNPLFDATRSTSAKSSNQQGAQPALPPPGALPERKRPVDEAQHPGTSADNAFADHAFADHGFADDQVRGGVGGRAKLGHHFGECFYANSNVDLDIAGSTAAAFQDWGGKRGSQHRPADHNAPVRQQQQRRRDFSGRGHPEQHGPQWNEPKFTQQRVAMPVPPPEAGHVGPYYGVDAGIFPHEHMTAPPLQSVQHCRKERPCHAESPLLPRRRQQSAIYDCPTPPHVREGMEIAALQACEAARRREEKGRLAGLQYKMSKYQRW